MKGIIEKVGLHSNMKNVWQYLCDIIYQNEKNFVFSLMSHLFPDQPNQNSFARCNELHIQRIFYDEIKHGKRLIVQK